MGLRRTLIKTAVLLALLLAMLAAEEVGAKGTAGVKSNLKGRDVYYLDIYEDLSDKWAAQGYGQDDRGRQYGEAFLMRKMNKIRLGPGVGDGEFKIRLEAELWR